MSLAAGIYTFMSANLSVGERIYPLTLPQGATLPALTYQTISDTTLLTHNVAQDHPLPDTEPLATTRVQFNCYGRTYDEAEALRLELLRVAVGFRGHWGDVPIGGVVPDIALDDYEPEPNHWRWLQDVLIKHRRTDGGS